MTVLAALWNYDGKPAGEPCGAMLNAQKASGMRPAVSDCDRVALGRAARAAIPEDSGEVGAVHGAAGALTLVADVRLDNRADLLLQLGPAGRDQAGCSDARLMMLCLERWGQEAIDGFVGDFALVLWDRNSEQLVLARDYAGQRPLFFADTDRTLAVASMVRGLHALEPVQRGVDRTRLLEMLAGLPHEGRSTFFRGIERVEPGEAVTFRPGGKSGRIFWTPPRDEIRLRSPGEYADALLEKLDAAVASRLRGVQGAVGAQLSAGLDSSAVTTSAARGWDGRILAFTSVPSGSLPTLPTGRFGDEGELAAETAALYANIEHHRIPMPDRLPVESIGAELEHYERPDLNFPNLTWANRINDAAAARGVEVMLTGNAGNGTISFGELEVLRLFLAGGQIGRFLIEAASARKTGFNTRVLLGLLARQFLPQNLLGWLGRHRNREQHPASAGGLNPTAPGAGEVIARYERAASRSFSSSVDMRVFMLRRVDPATYNKGVLLRWNIDLRDPTADRRLVEFCLRVPLRQYLRNGVSRALIRTALKGRIPDTVRMNRARGLQAANWFSLLSRAKPELSQLLEQISECSEARELLNLEDMRRRLENWPSAPGTYGSLAYRYGLLRGLQVGEFVRIFG